MSQKTCKWCGREFDGRNAESVSGWLTCSERCKHELKRSVQGGDTKVTKHPLVQLISFVFLAGCVLLSLSLIVNILKPSQAASVTSPVSQETQALEPIPASSSLDIATDSESSEPTEELKTETAESSSDSPLMLVGNYLKDDSDWRNLIEKNNTDDEGKTLPTDEDSYDLETEESVKNAIKLYQCMINEEGGDVDVDGEPSNEFQYALVMRVGTKAEIEGDVNYKDNYKKAKELRNQLHSK